MIIKVRHILLWMSLLVVASLCSCGDLIDFPNPDDEYYNDSIPVSLLRHELYIMVGDSCNLDVEIPATYSMSYYYTTGQTEGDGANQSLQIQGRSLHAIQPGDMKVYIHVKLYGEALSNKEVMDSCTVHVFDWQADHLFSDYPYSMVLYCQVNIDGVPISDNLEMAALSADDEVRGRAQLLQDGQTSYICLRIYSNSPAGDLIHLYCYDHTRVQRIRLTDQPIIFDGETHGTLSNPLLLDGTFQ